MIASLHALSFVLGFLLTLGTLGSVVSTTIVPRGTRSRIASSTAAALNATVALVVQRVDSWRRRDSIRAYEGPAYLVLILVVWLLLLLCGFTLMLWGFLGDLGAALRVAGSSMFTLGFAVPSQVAPTAVTFAAGATGMIVIALQIAYLPALYASFNRRETLVTVLTGAAGAPAWGPEILARYSIQDSLQLVGRLYERWTDWAADVGESHQAYPVLLYLRSPSADRSWVVSLLAVLDAAALHLSLAPISAPAEARQALNAGILAYRDLTARLETRPHTAEGEAPISLQRHDFDLAVERMQGAGFVPERELDEAWMHFVGWRVNYEREAYQLAHVIDAVPAVWSGPRIHGGQPVLPETAERLRPVDEATMREVEEIRRVGELRRQARQRARS